MSRERTSITFLKYDDNFKSYNPGDLIFKEEDPGMFMYVVKKGTVELSREGVSLEKVEAGQFFGEMALIEHSSRSATAKAVTECQIVPIDEEKFMYLVRQSPYFALDVLRVMARRLRHTTEDLANSASVLTRNSEKSGV